MTGEIQRYYEGEKLMKINNLKIKSCTCDCCRSALSL